jgi:CheY-like chemotaxis protein
MLRVDPSSPVRVLIVDNQVERATRLSSWLRTLSCKTAVGFDARGGIRLSELFRPSLVFISLGLPDGSAVVVQGEIRRICGTRPPLFVAVDPAEGAPDDPPNHGAGFDLVTASPIEPQVLLQMLEAATAYRDEAWERSLTGRRLEARAR